MFNFFKRTKIENWEIDLLRSVIMKLPEEYSSLINQIEDKLLKGVLTNISDIPGYVAFTFNPKLLKKYDEKNLQDYKLVGIEVYNDKSREFLSYEIYVSSGTISGYSLDRCKKYNLNLNKIDISNFRKEFIKELDYNRIFNLLTEKERKLLNPSNVYSVFLNKKEYFHIKDLEDGDFIGIDKEKNVYEIRHNINSVKKINKKLLEILN